MIPAGTYFDVYDGGSNTFLLRAQLPVLTKIFNFHPGATDRLISECEKPGGVCEMHMNRQRNPVGSGTFVVIQVAIGPRANY